MNAHSAWVNANRAKVFCFFLSRKKAFFSEEKQQKTFVRYARTGEPLP
jgi:hypothetical protein